MHGGADFVPAEVKVVHDFDDLYTGAFVEGDDGVGEFERRGDLCIGGVADGDDATAGAAGALGGEAG